MLLYHAISTYQILNCIVHRQVYNANEKSILLLPDFIVNKFPSYRDLETFELFDEIYLLPYDVQYEIGKIEGQIAVRYESTVPYKISDFRKIYVAGVHFPFTIYLLENKVPFHYFEDASGLMSHPDVVRNTMIDRFPTHVAVADHYNLFHPSGDLVLSRICKASAQDPNYKDSKMVDFDVVKEFSNLPLEKQNNVKRFFHCPDQLELPKKSALVLTQHLANLGVLDFTDQILLYQLFVDYFLKDYQLVFKPHPDDPIYYSLLFPAAHVIREKFPSEFLPYIFKNKPEVIATVSSTAINNLTDSFEKTLKLDIPFERHFKHIHKFFISLKCFEDLFSQITLYAETKQKYLFENLLLYTLTSKNKFSMSDDPTISNAIIFDMEDICDVAYSDQIIHLLDSLNDSQIACFFNCTNDYGFYNLQRKDLWDHIVPVVIKKQVWPGEDYYSDSDDELLYFYVKNPEMRKMIEQFSTEKELNHAGVKLSVTPLSKEEQRILVLEGILKATEKRLIHYIKREEELLEYIDQHNFKEHEK